MTDAYVCDKCGGTVRKETSAMTAPADENDPFTFQRSDDKIGYGDVADEGPPDRHLCRDCAGLFEQWVNDSVKIEDFESAEEQAEARVNGQ